MTWVENVSCSEVSHKIPLALEWAHMSSISEGPNDYIVALRNLDTVIAFAKDGVEVSFVCAKPDPMDPSKTTVTATTWRGPET